MEKSINLIEVEVRGLLSEEKFYELTEYLNSRSSLVEKDDKISYFFVVENAILKISDETSRDRAQISFKVGDESKSILEEYDIPILRTHVETAVSLFRELGLKNVNRVTQTRCNYLYEGACVSLKHTPDWGYHFELEMKASNSQEAKNIKKELLALCKKLDVKNMTPSEIKAFVRKINERHGFI